MLHRIGKKKKELPGILFVNSTKTWTWLVATSVSRRKFSSALYCSCSLRKKQREKQIRGKREQTAKTPQSKRIKQSRRHVVMQTLFHPTSWCCLSDVCAYRFYFLSCIPSSQFLSALFAWLFNINISVSYQLFSKILRNLMFVISIHDEFHECLLLFGEFNFFLDLKRKSKTAHHWRLLCLFESISELWGHLQMLRLPLTVWWWRWPACCRHSLAPPSHPQSTVLGRPWCSSAAF